MTTTRNRTSKGGVIVRETRRGRVFALRFRANGERQYETLGSVAEGWTEARAEQELEDRLAAIRLGVWKPQRRAAPTVEVVKDEPTFHRLSSDWVARRRHEVDSRSVEFWEWALSLHLLPFFKDLRPSQISAATVQQFTTTKLTERAQREAAIDAWRSADPKTRGRMPVRGLGNRSINQVLKVLAQVLDDAVDFGYVASNVARGKRRRLKAAKPRRTWLELHEVRALLDAAGQHRALLASMILTGLRVSELTAVRWRDVDLAGGTLRVAASKTEAGERVIDLTPDLLDELKVHRADARYAEPNDLVFPTSTGTMRHRSNVTRQILDPAINRANVELEKAGRNPIEGVTNHSLRRTFCALLYEADASPAYVMSQMGHTDASLALEIYAKVMERQRDTGERVDALLREPAYRALPGTGSTEAVDPVAIVAKEKPLFPAAS